MSRRYPRYRYRLVYRNGRVRYSPSHHLTLEKALARVDAFFSPTNDHACAPRRGWPYTDTDVVLEERSDTGVWVAKATYTCPLATLEIATTRR